MIWEHSGVTKEKFDHKSVNLSFKLSFVHINRLILWLKLMYHSWKVNRTKRKTKDFKQNYYWHFSEYVTYVTSCHFCHHESQNQMFFFLGNNSDRWPMKHWEQFVSSMLETFTAGQTGVRESFSLTWHFFSSSVTVGLNITQSVTVCTSTSWSTGWLISSGLAFSPNDQV